MRRLNKKGSSSFNDTKSHSLLGLSSSVLKFIGFAIVIVTMSWMFKTTVSESTGMAKEKEVVGKTTPDYSNLIWIGGKQFLAEIANTPSLMQAGMMYRQTMPDNAAMIFVYTSPQSMTFWMKNTVIPLDMLFFNEKGLLQEIKSNIPPCKTAKCPVYPAAKRDNQFVVEIKAGMSERLGINLGDKLNGCGLYFKGR